MVIFKYDISIRTHRLNRDTLVCFLILFLVAVTARGEAVELTLHPVKVDEQAQTQRLLVKSQKLAGTDAVPLYEKAIQQMPKSVNQKQIQEWLKLPIEQFPRQKAEDVIRKYFESLRLVARASRCDKCNWPEWKPGHAPVDVTGYRELIYAIRLWMRLDFSRGQYKNALAAMQTAFGMTQHLGQAPTIIQALVGATAGGVTCREIELFVQGRDAPNLYAALANLPEPLVDIEKAIENERANHKDQNVLVQKQNEDQLKTVFDRVRLNAKRLDNHVNALQVVEAIRHFAAMHEGQLPKALSDISDIDVPNDLISGKAFEYRRTNAGATLKSAIPEGFKERHAIHYEIELKK